MKEMCKYIIKSKTVLVRKSKTAKKTGKFSKNDAKLTLHQVQVQVPTCLEIPILACTLCFTKLDAKMI